MVPSCYLPTYVAAVAAIPSSEVSWSYVPDDLDIIGKQVNRAVSFSVQTRSKIHWIFRPQM